MLEEGGVGFTDAGRAGSFETLMETGEEALYTEVSKFESIGTEYVEFHVDFMSGKSNEKYDALREELSMEGGWCSVRFDLAAGAACEYSHDSEACKCHKPEYHTGQDIQSVHTREERVDDQGCQRIEGEDGKAARHGVRIPGRASALHFRRMSLLPRTSFAASRAPSLQGEPRDGFLVHGKSKEGSWGYGQLEEQVVDIMGVLEAPYPSYQLMIEIDHSAEHATYLEDGLHVGNMNVRFGGKQRSLRDTIMSEGCLGPGEAKMYLNRGT